MSQNQKDGLLIGRKYTGFKAEQKKQTLPTLLLLQLAQGEDQV